MLSWALLHLKPKELYIAMIYVFKVPMSEFKTNGDSKKPYIRVRKENRKGEISL